MAFLWLKPNLSGLTIWFTHGLKLILHRPLSSVNLLLVVDKGWDIQENKLNKYYTLLPTFAASTILAVASASSLAAASNFLELSTSTSASASDLMAFTRSEVAWANTRAWRTISPERGNGWLEVVQRWGEGEREMRRINGWVILTRDWAFNRKLA